MKSLLDEIWASVILSSPMHFHGSLVSCKLCLFFLDFCTRKVPSAPLQGLSVTCTWFSGRCSQSPAALPTSFSSLPAPCAAGCCRKLSELGMHSYSSAGGSSSPLCWPVPSEQGRTRIHPLIPPDSATLNTVHRQTRQSISLSHTHCIIFVLSRTLWRKAHWKGLNTFSNRATLIRPEANRTFFTFPSKTNTGWLELLGAQSASLLYRETATGLEFSIIMNWVFTFIWRHDQAFIRMRLLSSLSLPF